MTFINNKNLIRKFVRDPSNEEFIIDVCKENFDTGGFRIKCVEGLPEDACLIGSYSYQESATGYLMFSHESFAEVPLGEIIPTFTPKHEQYFVEKGEDDE